MNQNQSILNSLSSQLRQYAWLIGVAVTMLLLTVMAGDLAWAAQADAGGTTPPPASNLLSDDFNQCALNARWQYIDPLDDSTFEINGEQIVITVPAGVTHDLWEGNRNAPRLMQTVNNTDFEAEVKFESRLRRKYQLQGIVAQADADNLLRFNFQADGANISLVVVSFSGGTPTIIASEVVADSPFYYMRVRRTGNQWTVFYSDDGTTWQTKPSLTFTQSLTLTEIGPFIGNAGASPAFTGIIDYFFNTASPIAPEDPVINTIPVNIVGSGRVDKGCGTPLSLKAVPDLGWNFSGWSGDLSGNQNPATLAITGSEVVTATFTPKPLALNIQLNGGGTVRLNPDQIYFDNGDVVTLTAIPNRGWVFDGWSGDLTGGDVAKVLTMNSNKTVTANFRLLQDTSNIVSDDFNVCTLDSTLWSFTNPSGDATLTMSGSQVKLAVPGGTAHDVWDAGNNVPRIMQAADNQDFALETKFESVIDQRYQLQGVLIEADANNFIRINFQHNGSNTLFFGASFNNGAPRERFNQVIPDGAPLYLRVVRSGNLWAAFYSYNGEDWNTNSAMTFSYGLTVTKVGIFAGNAGETAPAHTAVVDYFFNSASPIAPEDPVVNALPPITIVGEGTVVRTPTCGNPIELVAVPADNWRFAGWSGDLTGTQNPVTVTAKGTERITATFAPVSGIQSDDFGACAIDPAWTFVNPLNDASYNRVDNQKIAIVVPADTDHDVYPNGNPNAPLNRAPRLMQPAADVDFELEAKFESALAEKYQLQGLLVEADTKNFLRFNYQHDGTSPVITAIGFTDGQPTTYQSESIIMAAPMYLRVNRSGDLWTMARSGNGVDWTTSISFTHALPVAQVGIFAGNAGRNPAHTALVDYFFETRNRIAPEDGTLNALNVTTVGNGSVKKSPESVNYNCGATVQLQATAAGGWTFTGWSGALTGIQNPATVTMDRSKAVTATFKENKYTITITTQGGTNGEEPGGTSTTAAGPYHEGQTVKLKATPKSGYRFVKWIAGSAEFTEAEIEVTVTGNMNYVAVFARIEGPTAYQIYMPVITR
ncbi:MAG TPA: DUF1349 domain-containing protein [Caldilineaceae bacterium]|nr:DUF1349 domain-containing protein [Caldilineaceae bacterium]